MCQRIGIVTGGGDCPGLNAVIRAVAKAATRRGWETLGIIGSWDGLLPPHKTLTLDYHALDGLLIRGGTVLGTSNRGQFSAKVGHGETRQLPEELLDATLQGFNDLGLNALVAIGGDGSMNIAQQIFEHGVPVVGVPKTIDNDLPGTAMTFGFDSAVACATDALDRLHTTAESHQRVIVLEVMGRYAGWIALYCRPGRRRRRHPHPRDPVLLRERLRQGRRAGEERQALHDRRGGRGSSSGRRRVS